MLTKLISFIPVIDNDYATTTNEAGNNKYGKYATIKQCNNNNLTTNQEIDQDDIGEHKDDDDNLQVTSKFNLTEKLETSSSINSAWVGSTNEPISTKQIRKNVEYDNQKQTNDNNTR